MSPVGRRRLLASAGGLLVAGLAPRAFGATAWPTRPVRLVIPYPPGGPTDIVGRIVGQVLAERLRQGVVIENRPGASGIIGADVVAKSPPDGYTLMITVSGQLVNPALYARMPHDPLKDFTPITNVAVTPIQLVVSAESPLRSVDDLIRLVRSQPGRYTFASSSNGTPGHLTAELFKATAGLDAIHVPYKGSAPALTDVMGGQVTYMFDSLPSSIAFVKGGKLRALGVTSPRRLESLPEVPTFAELNYPDINLTSWYGLWGPAKMPPDLALRINAEVRKVLADAEVRRRIGETQAEPVGDDVEHFAAYCQSEAQRYAAIVRAAGIRIE